ncbi:MAG: hydrogenase expression/formation protein HypE [Candidatus Competibacteraceae bacterium]|jgi:hydrogenase expression/formation protein HypE|nr:hydrogenase expression/formation protein HypE [Candidatus Competibacteraceae bacterium]
MTQDRWITLAHGNGGRFMRELIDDLFARQLANPGLDVQADAVPLQITGELMFTTDGFTVQPLEFPGGNIGSLAVHGTVNDLAVAGAIPRYLSLSAIIEEGLEFDLLERLMASLAEAARNAGVQVVAGDTKVVPRGQGGGLYLTTTGVGTRSAGIALGLNQIQAGDRLLVSGPVGDHGIAVMLAREEFGLSGDLQSDNACVLPLTRALLDLPGLRFMRDPTRGGLATVAYEISRATGLQTRLHEPSVPVHDPVRSVCEMLGYDPYYLACEGRVVAVVAPDQADQVLTRWRALPQGQEAALIGQVEAGKSPAVILETELGGERLLEELEDDPLPRIC